MPLGCGNRYREGVSEVDAFQWQSQLKSAWDEDIDDAKQFIQLPQPTPF